MDPDNKENKNCKRIYLKIVYRYNGTEESKAYCGKKRPWSEVGIIVAWLSHH